MAEKISGWIGSTNHQLAQCFGVDEQTITLWMGKYPSFSVAVKRARDRVDDEVEKCLMARAMGYTHPEEKIFCSEGSVVRATTTAHYPPSEVAMIFWLKNRRPELWRNREDGSRTPPADAAQQLREQIAEMDKVTAK